MPGDNLTTSLDAQTEQSLNTGGTGRPAGKGRGGGNKKPPPGSYMDRIPGRRPVKEYPLTEADMRDLAKTGLIATGSFSMATGLIGFSINLSKDFAFSLTCHRVF